MDGLYRPGTRIVLLKPPYAVDHAQILSKGLNAAGSPVVSYNGQRVLFAGKHYPDSDWQIYEAGLDGSGPRIITSMPRGAAHPALLPDGSVVFSSPAGHPDTLVSQLYVMSRSGTPRPLTFTRTGAYEPTMLSDGRILFLSGTSKQAESLFTINNDGTEITAFAAQHDSPSLLRGPRQLPDKRIVFLASDLNRPEQTRAELVLMARPFATRSNLLTNQPLVTCVAPLGASNLLICAQSQTTGSGITCFSIDRSSSDLGAPLFGSSGWDCIEAIDATAPVRPMGRLSNMDPQKSTGQLLCLDINDTTLGEGKEPAGKATRVRVTASNGPTGFRILGEVPVQDDGSFMAEVPADTLLGFEALNDHGDVLRREMPSMWVRPGENRSCVGCHAAHNRAPHNHRPLAVRVPVPKLGDPVAPPQNLARQTR